MSMDYSRIGDLFPNIKIGGTPSRGNSEFFNGSNLWVSIKDMGGKSVINSTNERLTDIGVVNSNCKLVQKGSMLFSFKLTVGRVAFAGEDLYTNEAIAAFDTESATIAEIDLDYLSLVLPMVAIKDSTKNSMGAPLLNKDRINNLSIPNPPLKIQLEIAAKLKAQLAEVETARKALEKQLSDINLFVSRLKDQLFSKLQPVGRVDLGELIIGIEAGKSFKTLERLASVTELAVLKVSAVSWMSFNPDEAKAVSLEHTPNDKHKVYKGDLIISRANTLELVGAVVRVGENYPNRLLSDKTLRLVCNEERVLPDYLLYALRWPEARLHIEANATGSSDSMRNISQKTIRTIPIPLPDKKIQQEIIDREKAITFHLNKVTHAHKQVTNDLNILPNKLLALAFNQ